MIDRPNMTAPARAAVFDLDGVLVDTAPIHAAGWRRVAADLGFTLTDDDDERLKGVSRYEALDIVLKIGGVTLSDPERDRIAEEKNEWYVSQISRLTPAALLPGAQDVLDRLRRHRVPTALASSSRNAPLIVRLTGIEDRFDAVVDAREVRRHKPDPEIFQTAARLLGVQAAACVIFEDAPAGVHAAAEAGGFVVGVGDPLVLVEADQVVSSLADVPLARLFDLDD